MRQFQDLGHKAVLIIGDYTARIGDPSGQDTTRPILAADQIESNARTYFEQAGKVLDTSPEKLEIRYNSQWLAELKLADILKLAGSITVARMLERDSFELRYKKASGVEAPQLSAQEVSLRLSLFPLFAKRIEFAKVSLEGVHLSLS